MNKIGNKVSLVSIFSGFIMTIPFLQYYKSPVSAINLATLITLVLGVLMAVDLVFRRKRVGIGKRFLLPAYVYILFIAANILVTNALYNNSFGWSSNRAFFRMVVLFFCIVVIGSSYFDLEYSLRILEKILTISAVGIILHVLLYSFAHIDFRLIIRSLIDTSNISVGYGLRSGGLYMEPSHYAQNAILYLIFYIYSDQIRENLSKRCFILIVIGIVFSMSGQGYAMLAFLYGTWVVINTFNSHCSLRRKVLVIGSIVLALVTVIVLYSSVPFVRYSISRIIDEEGNLGGSALQGRTWTNYKFSLLSDTQKLFGVGYGNIKLVTSSYVNSLYSYLIQCGYFSIPLFLFIGLYYFVYGNIPVKVHIVFFAIMFFFTTIANAMSIMFYFTIYSSGARLRYLNNQPLSNNISNPT